LSAASSRAGCILSADYQLVEIFFSYKKPFAQPSDEGFAQLTQPNPNRQRF
jgi:hypothetical protein